MYSLFITAVSAEAQAALDKNRKFNGTLNATYCLVCINPNTNKMVSEFFTGSFDKVLNAIYSKISPVTIDLINFRASAHNVAKGNKVAITWTKLGAQEIDLSSDEINSLTRLKTCSHIAITNVIGQRGNTNIEYGCVLADVKNGTCEMVSWKAVKEQLVKKAIEIHNVSMDSSGTLNRSNISALPVIFLKVAAASAQKMEEQIKQKEVRRKTETEQKAKLINVLTEKKSPMMYHLTDDYELDTMQYIIKIQHVTNRFTL